MKKKINEELVLYFTHLYPYKSKKKSNLNNKVTIGIGGNIGDIKKRFNKLFNSFLNDSRFSIIETSPILKNPPFGFLEQNDFLNAVIVLQTNLSVYSCLKEFQRYEKRFKRERSFQDAPRTLDIDIIFYNNLKLNTKNLTIPHKGYKVRDSVQIPLKYV
ncbi:MAG: 2-amino-4-hydroxy-6-hydroxymethyldihydropteridine diphosphokinase [Campylobacterota bacterium]|nr:2-amino-4-hydroxy-6-hydroxymethyldihydropteridine diphosphokinase [Campylobacterota bacterium]